MTYNSKRMKTGLPQDQSMKRLSYVFFFFSTELSKFCYVVTGMHCSEL